jgi:hypothetical protein
MKVIAQGASNVAITARVTAVVEGVGVGVAVAVGVGVGVGVEPPGFVPSELPSSPQLASKAIPAAAAR